jgi:hypothetical protein
MHQNELHSSSVTTSKFSPEDESSNFHTAKIKRGPITQKTATYISTYQKYTILLAEERILIQSSA